jgi:hypothetical protein
MYQGAHVTRTMSRNLAGKVCLVSIEVKRAVIKSWRVFFLSNHPQKALTCQKFRFVRSPRLSRLVNAAGIIISTRSNSSEMLLLDRNLDP